jgi:DNA-binding NtrC family response regulator/pSer/pThr/pTyr-binding forkhead associated (FHA) protein
VGNRSPDSALHETVPAAPPPAPPSAPRAYLLVVEGDHATTIAAPATGELVIGRGDEADVRLADPSVSRRHARVTFVDGDATVADLGSQNGTRVNEELVVGARPLLSGDVVTIGEASIVVRTASRPRPGGTIVDLARFRRRAEEELERSVRLLDPVTIVALALGARGAPDPEIAAALGAALSPIDCAAWTSSTELLALLPDSGAEDASERSEGLLAALGALAPAARAGWACVPDDGCALPALVESARAAAGRAAPAGRAGAQEAVRRITVRGHEILIADAAMLRLFGLLERLAASPLPVLITGETGTGKELAAAALHEHSRRKVGPLLAVNCAALPEGLVESELFGHERGAFSGAVSTKEGLFEAAHGGTVFLDEVGELPGPVQAKLLRVLEERRVTRVGATREIEVDVRVVAATHRDLRADVEAGRFRQDLYFRLGGATVWIPPLRDRPRELPLLARELLAHACVELGRPPLAITLGDGALRALSRHEWPGNVRELRNVMALLAATVPGDRIDQDHVADALAPPGAPSATPTTALEPGAGAAPAPRCFRPITEELRELERARMTEALEAAAGNRTRAAELLQMPLRTFMARLKQYGLGRG